MCDFMFRVKTHLSLQCEYKPELYQISNKAARGRERLGFYQDRLAAENAVKTLEVWGKEVPSK